MAIFLRFLLLFFACSILAFLFSYQSLAQVSGIDGPFLSLKGEATFKSNNSLDLGFVAPEFEDNKWTRVQVPGRFSDFGALPWHQVGWLRFRFRIPDDFQTENIAFVGNLQKQYEVYLNGTRLGGIEHFGDNVNALRYDDRLGRFSIFKIPGNILKQSSDNVLAVRFSRLMFIHDDGVLDGPFGLADYERASLANAPVRLTHYVVEGIFLGINAVFASLALGLIAFFGMRDRVLLWFATLITSLFVVDVLGSNWLIDNDWRNGLVVLFSTLLIPLGIVANMAFIASLLNIDTGRAGVFFAILAFLTIVPYFGTYNLPFEIALNIQMASTLLFICVWFLSFAWAPIASGWAIYRGNSDGWSILIVYTIFVSTPFIIELIHPAMVTKIVLAFGEGPAWLSKQFFFLSLSLIVGRRIYAIEKARTEANMRALRAQSDERQRVARDMHDSVGQWLGSVKMRLQGLEKGVRTNAPLSHESLREIVGDMEVIMDDTRRIARDLSPSSVAHKGLIGALREHLEYLRDDYGIAFDLQIDDRLTLDQAARDHIYRIVQEASRNSVIHGDAQKIEISLHTSSKGEATLNIKDDGAGFDTENSNGRHSLGLKSITERAVLLGGSAEIESGTEGTQITMKATL